MGMYTLKNTTDNIEDAFVEKVKSEAMDYERYFESWLENSPSLLFDDDESSKTVLWIGRQVTANVGNTDKYPDLLGIDSSGDLVIVELKKDKTPRDIIAQILEYASWGAKLEYDALNVLARNYYENDEKYKGKGLLEIFREVFEVDEANESFFNRKQKLYLVAEEISPIVRQVSEYLNETYEVNINHLEYEIFRTKDSDYLISVQRVLGFDKPKIKINEQGATIVSDRWSGNTKVKDVVFEAVKKHVNDEKLETFKPADIVRIVLNEYTNFNPTTVRCQIVADCVNHPSRKHYRGGQRDAYFWLDKGIYRLYNEETDGKWNREGKQI